MPSVKLGKTLVHLLASYRGLKKLSGRKAARAGMKSVVASIRKSTPLPAVRPVPKSIQRARKTSVVTRTTGGWQGRSLTGTIQYDQRGRIKSWAPHASSHQKRFGKKTGGPAANWTHAEWLTR
jgi:hypothetical protein